MRALAKSAGMLRPYLKAVRGADRQSQDGGIIVVLDGEPRATARLRAMLGVSADEPLHDRGGLLVHAAVEGHDPTLAAAVLAGAKREGRRVLAVVVGSEPARDRIAQTLLETRPLEASNVAHVASLDDPGPVHAAVVRCLDEEAPAAARRHFALRRATSEMLITRAARQAGTIGTVAIVPGADMPAMTLIQVRLVAQLAAVHGKPVDARRGLEIAGVLAGAFGWRAIARRAVGAVPVAGFAVRGGIAYSATRAVGEAAHTFFARAETAPDQPLEGFQTMLKRTLSRRGRG